MSGQLEHAPSDILRYLLVDLAVGTLPTAAGSWPINTMNMPDRPDNCICVYDTDGQDHGREMIQGERQESHGVQIKIRSADPDTGFKKARAIALVLDQTIYDDAILVQNNGNTTPQHYLVHSVTRRSGVLNVGKETPTSKRNVFTINAVISLRQI